MSQTVAAASTDAERAGDRVDDRAGQHERQRHGGEQHDHHERDEDLQRAQLPERPPLRRLVDDVRGAHERADVARGRPQRDAEADDEQDPGRAAGSR